MTTKRYATRDFNDAGTEQSFTAGDEIVGCTDGQLDNYGAAGLASEEQPKTAKAATSSGDGKAA